MSIKKPRLAHFKATVIAVLVAVGALSGSLAWSAMIPLTLEQMCSRSENIFLGKVKRLSEGYVAQWPGVGSLIYTDVTIEIEDTWKGKKPGREVTLQVHGGTLASGRWMRTPDAPRFKKGERVVVFTTTVHGKNQVFAWDQGKYRVVKSRVVSKKNYPIGKDVLIHALKRKIARLVGRGK